MLLRNKGYILSYCSRGRSYANAGRTHYKMRFTRKLIMVIYYNQRHYERIEHEIFSRFERESGLDKEFGILTRPVRSIWDGKD
jgi:hypothetical protein